MTSFNPWSTGMSSYPLEQPFVGQDRVFQALQQFRTSARNERLAAFAVITGDWGSGKSRLAHQLVSECTGRTQPWLVEAGEGQHASVRLFPEGEQGRDLVLYSRYLELVSRRMVAATTWIEDVAVAALQKLVTPEPRGSIGYRIQNDLLNTLTQRGFDRRLFADIVLSNEPSKDAYEKARAYLKRELGVDRLWVVIDEIETLEENDNRPEGVALPPAEVTPYIDMIRQVVKDEDRREAFPNLLFVMLASKPASARIDVRANDRRAESLSLEPYSLGTVRVLGTFLRQEAVRHGLEISYLTGTEETAFFASRQNMGWYNILMSFTHERLLKQPERSLTSILREYAALDQAKSRGKLFNGEPIHLIDMQGLGDREKGVLLDVIYRQIPTSLAGLGLTESELRSLTAVPYTMTGRPAIVTMRRVEITPPDLANALRARGFRSDESQAILSRGTTRINPVGLLNALRAFSAGDSAGGCLVYEDAAAFQDQLAAVYQVEGLEAFARDLHQMLLGLADEDSRFVAPSMALLRHTNALWASSRWDTNQPVFELTDPEKVGRIETAVGNWATRDKAYQLCLGTLKVLEGQEAEAVTTAWENIESRYVVGKTADSPFSVSPTQQMVVLYGTNPDVVVNDLQQISTMGLFPVVVICEKLDHVPDIRRMCTDRRQMIRSMPMCVLMEPASRDSALILRYSLSGGSFSDNDLKPATKEQLVALRERLSNHGKEWLQEVEGRGELIRAMYATNDAPAIRTGLARTLQYMATGKELADVLDQTHQLLEATELQKLQRYLTYVGSADSPYLKILKREPGGDSWQMPTLWKSLLAKLRAPHTAGMLVNQFFYQRPSTRVQATSAVEQSLEIMAALGWIQIVNHPGQGPQYIVQRKETLVSKNQRYREAAQLCLGWARDADQSYPAGPLLRGLSETEVKEAQRSLEASLDELERLRLEDIGGALTPADLWEIARAWNLARAKRERICPENPEPMRLHGDISDFLATVEGRWNQDLTLYERLDLLSRLRVRLCDQAQKVRNTARDTKRMLEDYERPFEGYVFPTKIARSVIDGIVAEADCLGQRPTPGDSIAPALRLHGFESSVAYLLGRARLGQAWQQLIRYEVFVSQDGPLLVELKECHNIWKTLVGSHTVAQREIASATHYFRDAPQRLADLFTTAKDSLEDAYGSLESLSDLLRDRVDADRDQTGLLRQSLAQIETAVDNDRRALDLARCTAEEDLRGRVNGLKLDVLHKASARLGRITDLPTRSSMFEGLDTYRDQLVLANRLPDEIEREGAALCGTESLWAFYVSLYRSVEVGEGTIDYDEHLDDIQELERLRLISVLWKPEVRF